MGSPAASRFKVLLWLLDGAERRRQLHAKPNDPKTTVGTGAEEIPMETVRKLPIRTRLPVAAWALAGVVTLFSLVTSVSNIHVAPDRPGPVARDINSATDAHHASLTDVLELSR
jgi:hypothetical protein